MCAGLGPTWRSVRHTRPRQLLARLRLMVKRRSMAALARRLAPPGSPELESLAAFAKRYFLAEFDGRSDECLKLTWPPKRK